MKKVQLLFLISFICFSAIASENFGCMEGKLKYLDGTNEILLKESYCFDSFLRSISSYKKCPNKECSSNLPGPFPLKEKDVHGEQGSPGFKICEKLNGIPQFIEFWDKETWIKSSRCIFNDGSFVDIASLSLKVKYVD